MIARINGTLLGVKMNHPDKRKGQDFNPNQSLSLAQPKPDGDVDLVKVKDENMATKYEVGKPISLDVEIRSWQMGNKSGFSCKVLDLGKA